MAELVLKFAEPTPAEPLHITEFSTVVPVLAGRVGVTVDETGISVRIKVFYVG